MDSVVARVRARSARRAASTRGGGLIELSLVVLVVLALGATLVIVRTRGPETVTVSATSVTGGAPSGTPIELKAAAATLLERAIAKGGGGYRFDIVQRSTITARSGGPRIEIPDPSQPRKVLRLADDYYLIGLT